MPRWLRVTLCATFCGAGTLQPVLYDRPWLGGMWGVFAGWSIWSALCILVLRAKWKSVFFAVALPLGWLLFVPFAFGFQGMGSPSLSSTVFVGLLVGVIWAVAGTIAGAFLLSGAKFAGFGALGFGLGGILAGALLDRTIGLPADQGKDWFLFVAAAFPGVAGGAVIALAYSAPEPLAGASNGKP